MFRWIHATSFLFTALALFAFVAAPGCQPTKKKEPDKEKQKEKESAKEKGKDEHDHGEFGPHGGPLAEWSEVYHAEFTADHPNKMVIVYILDDKAKKAPDVEASRFTKVKLHIPSDKLDIMLSHDAKKSGSDGIAFTGTHDFIGKAAAFKGNLSATVTAKDKKEKDAPYAGDFEYDPAKKAPEKKK